MLGDLQIIIDNNELLSEVVEGLIAALERIQSPWLGRSESVEREWQQHKQTIKDMLEKLHTKLGKASNSKMDLNTYVNHVRDLLKEFTALVNNIEVVNWDENSSALKVFIQTNHRWFFYQILLDQAKKISQITISKTDLAALSSQDKGTVETLIREFTTIAEVLEGTAWNDNKLSEIEKKTVTLRNELLEMQRKHCVATLSTISLSENVSASVSSSVKAVAGGGGASASKEPTVSSAPATTTRQVTSNPAVNLTSARSQEEVRQPQRSIPLSLASSAARTAQMSSKEPTVSSAPAATFQATSRPATNLTSARSQEVRQPQQSAPSSIVSSTVRTAQTSSLGMFSSTAGSVSPPRISQDDVKEVKEAVKKWLLGESEVWLVNFYAKMVATDNDSLYYVASELSSLREYGFSVQVICEQIHRKAQRINTQQEFKNLRQTFSMDNIKEGRFRIMVRHPEQSDKEKVCVFFINAEKNYAATNFNNEDHKLFKEKFDALFSDHFVKLEFLQDLMQRSYFINNYHDHTLYKGYLEDMTVSRAAPGPMNT